MEWIKKSKEVNVKCGIGRKDVGGLLSREKRLSACCKSDINERHAMGASPVLPPLFHCHCRPLIYLIRAGLGMNVFRLFFVWGLPYINSM